MDWQGGPPPDFYPHIVACDCPACLKGLKGRPELAKPALVRLIGEAQGSLVPKEPVDQSDIKTENKRIRHERMKRIALAMHGKRTRNKRTS